MVNSNDTRNERYIAREIDAYQDDVVFLTEVCATDLIEQVLTKMEEDPAPKTQTRLAEIMGVPRQQVSRMFNSPPNLTILSLIKLGKALRAKPRIVFDSQAYYIKALKDNPSYEEFKTDQAMWTNAIRVADAQATSNATGGNAHATA